MKVGLLKRDGQQLFSWLQIVPPPPPPYQVIPSHGNPQVRRTFFDGFLFKYCSVKYETFHQVSEKASQQTYSHQNINWKAFQMPPRAMEHQLTCPIELTSGSFLIGGKGILVIPRNRLVHISAILNKNIHIPYFSWPLVWKMTAATPLEDQFTWNFATMCPKRSKEKSEILETRWKGSRVLAASLMARAKNVCRQHKEKWSLKATSHSTIFDIPMRLVGEDQRDRRRFTGWRLPAIPVMVIIPLNFARFTLPTHGNR